MRAFLAFIAVLWVLTGPSAAFEFRRSSAQTCPHINMKQYPGTVLGQKLSILAQGSVTRVTEIGNMQGADCNYTAVQMTEDTSNNTHLHVIGFGGLSLSVGEVVASRTFFKTVTPDRNIQLQISGSGCSCSGGVTVTQECKVAATFVTNWTFAFATATKLSGGWCAVNVGETITTGFVPATTLNWTVNLMSGGGGTSFYQGNGGSSMLISIADVRSIP